MSQTNCVLIPRSDPLTCYRCKKYGLNCKFAKKEEVANCDDLEDKEDESVSESEGEQKKKEIIRNHSRKKRKLKKQKSATRAKKRKLPKHEQPDGDKKENKRRKLTENDDWSEFVKFNGFIRKLHEKDPGACRWIRRIYNQ